MIPRPLRRSSTFRQDQDTAISGTKFNGLDLELVEGSGVGREGRGDIGVRFDPSTDSGHRKLNELRDEKVPELVERSKSFATALGSSCMESPFYSGRGHTPGDRGCQPVHECGVDFDRPFLGHPVAGANRGFRQVAAVGSHGFGQPGVDAFAHEVVGRGAKQDRRVDIAAVQCGCGIGRVDRVVHVPRRRTEEAVALQCRGVHAEILLAHHVGVTRHVGNFAESSE